ncbi:imidazole glycerol phosphate synthase, partial [candidate division MSBL1 archaeon SCGC-AAA259E17]
EKDCPIFRGIEDGYVYYAHSYHVNPQGEVLVATSEYGTDVTASVWDENIFGTQFHPEKSGKLGLKILQNFLEI